MQRLVQPELLDTLPPVDSRAVNSRADLRRLNAIMGHARILTRLFKSFSRLEFSSSQTLRIVELGAGDGTLMANLARRWAAFGIIGEVTLVDRQPVVTSQTLELIRSAGWKVETVEADVFAWLKETPHLADVVLINLFLHHFEEPQLRELLKAISVKTNLLITCEPRRSGLALTASRLLGLIGCNAVTRHDAVVSVRAGFNDKELSGLWVSTQNWRLSESGAGLFSHSFVAKRDV